MLGVVLLDFQCKIRMIEEMEVSDEFVYILETQIFRGSHEPRIPGEFFIGGRSLYFNASPYFHFQLIGIIAIKRFLPQGQRAQVIQLFLDKGTDNRIAQAVDEILRTSVPINDAVFRDANDTEVDGDPLPRIPDDEIVTGIPGHHLTVIRQGWI